jgi:hypothetical protein
MQNRSFTISIALVLLLAGAVGRAEAKQPNFVSHFANSGVSGAIDTNGDGLTAPVFTGIHNTTLGRFLSQGESETLPPLATNLTCPASTPKIPVLEIPVLQIHTVLTHERTTEQLFLTETSGAACLDLTTFTLTFQGQGTFDGGTGRFVHATGTWEINATGTILVIDPQGHNLGTSSGTLTGTISGVGDGGD